MEAKATESLIGETKTPKNGKVQRKSVLKPRGSSRKIIDNRGKEDLNTNIKIPKAQLKKAEIQEGAKAVVIEDFKTDIKEKARFQKTRF